MANNLLFAFRKTLDLRRKDLETKWQNLRAAVLCIGLGKYEHLQCLPNAQRDARALCERVNELPRCRAKLLVDIPDRKAIQRGIRNFLKEPGLQKMPTETVYINYSGHGMQKAGTVYMLPEDADLDPACDPDAEFLPLRDIFKYCREDLDMLARDLDPPRQVTFVLVVDACRVAGMDQAALSSSLEPPAASAPKKWALCFSCSRKANASDCPQGAHSPFAQELLDEKVGIFAAGVPLKGGLEEACRRVCEHHQAQVPIPVGLHSIQEDWCFYPNPDNIIPGASILTLPGHIQIDVELAASQQEQLQDVEIRNMDHLIAQERTDGELAASLQSQLQQSQNLRVQTPSQSQGEEATPFASTLGVCTREFLLASTFLIFLIPKVIFIFVITAQSHTCGQPSARRTRSQSSRWCCASQERPTQTSSTLSS
ncbi:MAG: caspase domain-containing protein [Dolichospermum sp.]